jgi:L-threonylcarbamoyladenylate synthase
VKLIPEVNSPSILAAAEALLRGHLVAFPTETVYGLGADASNEIAVKRMYRAKNRPLSHPSIIHVSSLKKIYFWVENVSDYALILARAFWPGPMTLIFKRTSNTKDFITGNQDSVGVRIPENEIAQSLLKKFESIGGHGVVAPSANQFGRVSPTSSQDVISELSSKLEINDLILEGGKCKIGIESTIIDCRGPSPVILRPGYISVEMINLLPFFYKQKTNFSSNKFTTVRHSGSLNSHYAPNARVLLKGTPKFGDGLIAKSIHETPDGVVRLSSPDNDIEFAHELYSSLRYGDKIGLKNIYIIPPEGLGLAEAIKDRIQKAAGIESTN